MIEKRDIDFLRSYLADSSNLKGGYADALLVPGNFEELASVLTRANREGTGITVSGGGTGTSGGRIPFGGVIVSTEKLNSIGAAADGRVTADCGVMIKDLKSHIARNGYFYSYDPTEQTAFVGGTVATNASGARSFKYGPTRASVIGLKIALASGSVLDIKRGEVREKGGILRFKAGSKEYTVPVPAYEMPKVKSSAGYYASRGMDLVDLFIGQEGTLGVILQATLKLLKMPGDMLSCFAFFTADDNALAFAQEARELSYEKRSKGGPGIDAVSLEYFDFHTIGLLKERYGGVPGASAACVFFEQEIDGGDEDRLLDRWVALMSKYGAEPENTWVAMNEAERAELLEKRHAMGEAMNEMARRNNMPKVATDIAVPHTVFPEMMECYRRELSGCGIEHYLFGHIGDSHIHMNLIPRDPEELGRAKEISLIFIKKAVSIGGTVSAEHGIGKTRREYLKLLYGENGIKQMIEVKRALDPGMILSPGNIFEVR
ncbi:MAG: FAD-binding oxidoreductase [Candidatus Omnitrophota bacterium]